MELSLPYDEVRQMWKTFLICEPECHRLNVQINFFDILLFIYFTLAYVLLSFIFNCNRHLTNVSMMTMMIVTMQSLCGQIQIGTQCVVRLRNHCRSIFWPAVHQTKYLLKCMGGATGVCGEGQCLGPGATEGRSNENDLCFYSRQSLFGTVQVTEFHPLTLVDTCQVNDIWKDGLGRVSTVHPHWIEIWRRNRFLGTGSKICYPVPQTGTRNRFTAS